MKDLWSNLASDLQDSQFQLLHCFIFASTAILIWVLGLWISGLTIFGNSWTAKQAPEMVSGDM